MSDLPAHLTKGRGAFAGPVSGGYVVYTPTIADDMGINQTDAIMFAVYVPADFRLMSIVMAGFGGATASSDLHFYTNTTVSVTGATQLTTTSGGSQTTPVTTVWDAQSSISWLPPGAGGDQDLVTTARDINRGSYIMGAVTTDGSAVTPTNTVFTITGFLRGHMTVNPDFD